MRSGPARGAVTCDLPVEHPSPPGAGTGRSAWTRTDLARVQRRADEHTCSHREASIAPLARPEMGSDIDLTEHGSKCPVSGDVRVSL
jgi:hypothetical protein